MRFYIMPGEPGDTNCINFDHVAKIRVTAKTIELFLVGIEAPIVIPKTPAALSQVAKGMDLSDSSKDFVNNL